MYRGEPMANITLLNMNMLYLRYYDSVERELHVPLGTLYLTRVLEDAGFSVDFRDYQTNTYENPFSAESICDFLTDSADLVGVSVMANLLPFIILGLKKFKELHPNKTIVLGGVGPKSVEKKILERFPWIDAIATGEGERMIGPMVEAHRQGHGFANVPNMIWRNQNGTIIVNNPALRITDLDSIPFPAWHRIDLMKYRGYGMMTSRGCPYPCTFCSVAPVWGRVPYKRSSANIVEEMKELRKRANVELFLFQDEFFVSSSNRVVDFCNELKASGLKVYWKAFGRINLSTTEMMRSMADNGCVEMRYGIESASDKILERIKKGFQSQDAVKIVSESVKIFRRVDTFYVWGFPFETMDDFYQSLFQMISFRMIGARILPSLLCFLPQTDIFLEYGENGKKLEFCHELLPEYMLTGHEICKAVRLEVAPAHVPIFAFIQEHPDIFSGFFHWDLKGNVFPKLRVLQEMGFYPSEVSQAQPGDSCGAHSPRVAQATTAQAQLRAI